MKIEKKMHTSGETGVPAFLAKLWRLVEDPETNEMISWSPDGRSFMIYNQAKFARELLPLNYKHNNMASFIRQLNMYGFHKITSIENGGLKFDRDEMEFSHPCFKRGCPFLLEHIKRKIASSKTLDLSGGSGKNEVVNKVLNEVKQMRGRQDSLDSRFSAMKQENEALWREIASLRQKHMKQQQIVNKLIQFLVTIMQPNRNMGGVKRNFQLMINDTPKAAKIRRRQSESDSGAIIHELTEELLDEVADSDSDIEDPISPKDVPLSPNYSDRPKSNVSINSPYYENSQHSLNNDNIEQTSNEPPPQLVYQISELPEDVIQSRDASRKNDLQDKNFLNLPIVEQEIAKKLKSQKPIQTGQKDLASKANLKIDLGSTCTNVKAEIDPMIFFDTASSGGISNQSLDENLMQSNVNNNQLEAVNQITNSVALGINDSLQTPQPQQQSQADNLYSRAGFLRNDLTSDLFDNPIIQDINITTSTTNNNKNMNEENQLNNFETNSGASTSRNIPSDYIEDGDNNMVLAKYNKKTNQSNDFNAPHGLTQHVDNIETDLGNLKDLLRSEGYTFDANTLFSNANPSNRLYLPTSLDGDNVLSKLFNDPENYLPSPIDNSKKEGSELVSYQPYYSDLSDMLDDDSNLIN